MKTWWPETYGMQQSCFKREIYSNTILPHETKKTSNRQLNFTPKTTGKRTKNPKISKKERNHKDQRINKWNRNENI